MRLSRIAALVALSATAFCSAQAKKTDENPVPKYLVIALHQVRAENVTAAVFCSPSVSNCGAVYFWKPIYIPFPTLQQALAYMNGVDLTIPVFGTSAAMPTDIREPRLVELNIVPVKVEEKKESIAQPPIEKTHTTYSEIK